ncbi:hypothetical protein MMC17_006922 [Xylographa soralifera]|nr:hypothetical protein [Xylographa soralifera]
MPVKPITGMLRRGLVLDLSIAFGQFEIKISTKIHILHQSEHGIGIYTERALTSSKQVLGLLLVISTGTVCNCQHALHTTWIPRTRYMQWYSHQSGYHIPATRRRDLFYAKLEDQRAEAAGVV